MKKIILTAVLLLALILPISYNSEPVKYYSSEPATQSMGIITKTNAAQNSDNNNQNQEQVSAEPSKNASIATWRGWIGVVLAVYLISIFLLWTFLILAISALWRWLKINR